MCDEMSGHLGALLTLPSLPPMWETKGQGHVGSRRGQQGVRGYGDGNLAPQHPAVGRFSDSLVDLLAYIVCDYIFRGRIVLY